MRWKAKPKFTPSKFNGTGDYYILIVTSGSLLKWPCSRFGDPPMYDTKESAEKIIAKYVKFSNENSRTLIKRVKEEFEVVAVSEYKQN